MCVDTWFDGDATRVCNRCVACKWRMRRAFIGRAILEAQHAPLSLFATFTFDPSSRFAYYLTTRPFASFRNRAQRRWGQFSYFGSAEIGPVGGLLHYHVCLFFWDTQKMPIPLFPGQSKTDRRHLFVGDGTFENSRAPWVNPWSAGRLGEGHAQFLHFEPSSAFYASKYLFKDRYKLLSSRSPFFGRQGLEAHASRMAADRIPLNVSSYQILGQHRIYKNGSRGPLLNFPLRGKAADLFCDAFSKSWQNFYGCEPEGDFYWRNYHARQERVSVSDRLFMRVRFRETLSFNDGLLFHITDNGNVIAEQVFEDIREKWHVRTAAAARALLIFAGETPQSVVSILSRTRFGCDQYGLRDNLRLIDL